MSERPQGLRLKFQSCPYSGHPNVQKIQGKFVDTKLNSLTKMGKINENKAQVGQNFEN